MFLSEGSCSAVCKFFTPLTCARQTNCLFYKLSFFSALFLHSFSSCLSWCCIWPINNVIPNQWLLGSAVITSSIIWPHHLLLCKQPSSGQKELKADRHTYTKHAQTSETQTDKPVTSLYSPSLLPHLSASLCSVSQVSISQYWPQEAVPHILAHLWEHFHSARWLTSSPCCDSSVASGEIKTVAAKSNLQQGGRDNSSDQHVTPHLDLMLWGFMIQTRVTWLNISSTAKSAGLFE